MSVKSEREYLAEHLRIITSSGMCQLDKRCTMCDCFNAEFEDEDARRLADGLVQVLGLHWEEARGETGLPYKRLVSRYEDG